MNRRQHAIEIEATLILMPDQVEAVLQPLRALTSIAGYRLRPGNTQRIHDLYVDTVDAALRHQDLALRVRRVDSARLIALKGKSRLRGAGEVERLELERPWSLGALAEILQALVDNGIELRPPATGLADGEPEAVLDKAGLVIVQERDTQRMLRDVFDPDQDGHQPVGELAIDESIYHLGGRDVRHDEIELEGKVPDAFPGLNTVVEALLKRFGPAVRRWEHSKLATGHAIAKLLQHDAPLVLDGSGRLQPDAYIAIDRYLKQAGATPLR